MSITRHQVQACRHLTVNGICVEVHSMLLVPDGVPLS